MLASGAVPVSAAETWILNGILCTQNETRAVKRGHLRIVDGKIVEIRDNFPQNLPASAQTIDASGLTILPGFVQAHVHLCQTLFRNMADDLELLDWLSKRIWIMEAAHTEETLYTSASLGIYELLSSGTTCILDMGTVRHTHSILEAVKDTGIRASVGKCLMDHPDQTPSYLRETTQEALKEANFIYEKWHKSENDRIRVSYAPRFVISCTETLLREVSKLSLSQNALVHTHASENLKEIELVRKLTQRENVEYLSELELTSSRLVLAHGVWLNAKEKEIIKKTNTHIAHCPSSNMKLASGFARVPELREMGINVALGADGAPCNNHLDIFTEMRMAALIHKPTFGPRSMRATEVLDMATRDGAKALNWFDDIGSIEIGKRADLVALNLSGPFNTVPIQSALNLDAIASSIVYSSHPSHVYWTMVDGKVVYEKDKIINQESSLMKKVNQAQKLFLQAINTGN